MTDEIASARKVIETVKRELELGERLLHVAAAAQRLHRKPETIRKYIRSGRLRAHRPAATDVSVRGGNYLIPESALIEFMQGAK